MCSSLHYRRFVCSVVHLINHVMCIHQFKFLVSDIKNYLSSVGAEDHILQLVQRLSAVTTAPANEFAEERMWQKTQGSFLDNLDERFPLYRDLVTPFSVAVSLVRHGVRLVAGSVQQHQLRQQLIGQDAQGTEDSEVCVLIGQNVQVFTCSFLSLAKM